MMTYSISVKQKEAKTVGFTISGTFSLTAAVFTFGVKKNKADTTYTIKKDDADFDKTEIASRKVKIKLSADNLNQSGGMYIGELKTVVSADNIDKSNDIDFEIIGAVIT